MIKCHRYSLHSLLPLPFPLILHLLLGDGGAAQRRLLVVGAVRVDEQAEGAPPAGGGGEAGLGGHPHLHRLLHFQAPQIRNLSSTALDIPTPACLLADSNETMFPP